MEKKSKMALNKNRKRKASNSEVITKPKTVKLEVQEEPTVESKVEEQEAPAVKVGTKKAGKNKNKNKKNKALAAPKETTEEDVTEKVETKNVPLNKAEKNKEKKATQNDTSKEESDDANTSTEDSAEMPTPDKYPVLQDKELIEKFLKVPFTNNQKGRIRQAIRTSLESSSKVMYPDIIHGKIQAILKSSKELKPSELRRIRILFNMLKTSLSTPETETDKPKKKKNKSKKKKKGDGEADKIGTENGVEDDKEKKKGKPNKVKGPKRYVVFIGNLPVDIEKEKIMTHFSEISEHIQDVRIIPPAEGKKAAIAFMELKNDPSFELALSKNHTMLENRRINVAYTTQKNGKVSEAEAKGKSAKLKALQKAGKLVGSVAQKKKRSHRRMIMKQAKAKEAAANN